MKPGWFAKLSNSLAATYAPLFLTPVAYRFLAPLSKPRVHETRLLVEELEAARSKA